MFSSLASLRKAKHLPQAGAVDAAVHAKARAQLLSVLPDAVFESAPAKVTYFMGFAQSLIYKPVAASAAAVVFLAGGWMTTSAAQSSLPGDTLYNVKLIAERAQLQLASLDRRAVLHTEFAGRRLEEVAALQRAVEQEPARAQYISETVTAYQQEIASATTDLQTLQTQDQEQALTTAATVLEQVAILTEGADELAAGTPTDVQQEVAQESQDPMLQNVAEQVAQTTETIAEIATDVAINAHEAVPTEESRREMESMFRALLGSIEARRAMTLHRIAKIEELSVTQKAALAQAGVTLPKRSEFSAMKKTVEDLEGDLPELMDGFAAGGYRTAIDAMREKDVTLKVLENELTVIEEQITGTFVVADQKETSTDGTDQPVSDTGDRGTEPGTGESAQ